MKYFLRVGWFQIFEGERTLYRTKHGNIQSVEVNLQTWLQTSDLQTMTCFCTTRELRMVFTFFKDSKGKEYVTETVGGLQSLKSIYYLMLLQKVC